MEQSIFNLINHDEEDENELLSHRHRSTSREHRHKKHSSKTSSQRRHHRTSSRRDKDLREASPTARTKHAWGETEKNEPNTTAKVRIKIKPPLPHLSTQNKTTMKPNECDFVRLNRDSLWKQDTLKSQLKERAKSHQKEKQLGKVPQYILNMKLKAAIKKEEIKQREDRILIEERQKLGRLMTEKEKRKLIKRLKLKRQELENDFQRYSYTNYHGAKRLIYIDNLVKEMDRIDAMLLKLDNPHIFVTAEDEFEVS